MNIALIEKMIDQGFISRRKHPHCDLFILNYTSAAQVERVWNKATMMCRGLIVDKDWNIVGRPFEKFFTLDQFTSIRNHVNNLYGMKYKRFYSELWTRPFRAFDKLDGSLGIIFYNPFTKKWEVASRGSFISDQAVEANRMLALMEETEFEQGETYVVEIIYPENRIVVDYKGRRKLILLAVINNETGKDDWAEFEIQRAIFATAGEFEGLEYLDQLEAIEQDDTEGMVFVFDDGFRLKFKYDEYLRLHRILTCVTKRKVWEKLRAGEGFLEWMKDVPDEFYKWIVQTKLDLMDEYAKIENEAFQKLKEVRDKSRHIMADRLRTYKYRGIAFKMLDGGKYEDMIWRLVKPPADKPFTLS